MRSKNITIQIRKDLKFSAELPVGSIPPDPALAQNALYVPLSYGNHNHIACGTTPENTVLLQMMAEIDASLISGRSAFQQA
jgi:hypothetical protein